MTCFPPLAALAENPSSEHTRGYKDGAGPHAESGQTAPGLSVLHRALPPEKPRLCLRVAWALPNYRPENHQPLRLRVTRQCCSGFVQVTLRPSRIKPVDRRYSARRTHIPLAQAKCQLRFPKSLYLPPARSGPGAPGELGRSAPASCAVGYEFVFCCARTRVFRARFETHSRRAYPSALGQDVGGCVRSRCRSPERGG